VNISDEAVEAAHEAWRAQAATEGIIFEYNLRAALEAAAPYMLAPVFEEGYGWGYSDSVWSKGHEPRDRNPYRSEL
jgi:hypothetical protein